jgi:thiosulfate dehydrogenase (quinone) large subunit
MFSTEAGLLDSAPMNAGARLAAVVRILAGVLFIASGFGKATGPFVRGGFAKSAEQLARDGWPFWGSFLKSVVLPRAEIFGWIVAVGELAVGIGLLLGFLTRIAAVSGALLLVAILLGQSCVPGTSWDHWITAGLTTKFALLLLLLIAAVGYAAWGLDGILRRPKHVRLR